MRLIQTDLFAGTRKEAEDEENLKEHHIARVLTVDSEPLPHTHETINLYINCLDEPSADLLTSLDRCVRFIDEGLTNNEAVLVHCLSGVSRSVTVLLAYLMKMDNMNLDEAINKMNHIYNPQKVSPNAGFMDQLRLYEEMGKTVDMSSSVFKQFRLTLLASQIQDNNHSEGSLMSTFLEEVKCRKISSDKLFKCRKCRCRLFESSNLVGHEVGEGSSSFGCSKWGTKNSGQMLTASVNCTSLFVEPVDWMLHALSGNVDGKLICPKCHCRLGSFNWSGMQCSCASWVTPAFQFHKTKVDEMFKVQPVLNPSTPISTEKSTVHVLK